jgi:hypothetical protein
MIFDDLEVAKDVYNDYAYKLGFRIRIGNTKFSQARGVPRDTILSRLFECVHTGKPANEDTNSCSKKTRNAAKTMDTTIDMSSTSGKKSKGKQAGLKMDVTDTRQRNKVQWHDCKAHRLVGRREGNWTVTVFHEEHTHPMVSQIGRRRFRSHRKVPEEDF